MTVFSTIITAPGALSLPAARLAAAFALMLLGLGFMVAGLVLLIKALKRRGPEREEPPAAAAEEAQQTKEKRLFVAADSQLGDRKNQQDSCGYAAELSAEQEKMGVLGVVCDGMGGMEGGELASRICAETIYNGYYQLGEAEDICAVLRELVIEADREVAALCDSEGRKLNSGTTAVAAVICRGRAYWVSTGDSRIYHIHGGTVRQLTRDHNLKLKLLEAAAMGRISFEEAQNHPQREALISYVGKGGDLIVDTGIVPFEPDSGDMLLLCSDGVYKVLDNNRVLSLAMDCLEDPTQAAALIARTAVNTGNVKHDNTTVLVFCYK